MRYSVGREGTWSLIGGSFSPSQTQINNLFNEEYVDPAFSVPAFAQQPQAQVGHRVRPIFNPNLNLRPLTTNRTYFLINNADNGTFYGYTDTSHNRTEFVSGTSAQLTMWGWYGTAASIGNKLKIKFFRQSGNDLFFLGEDIYECTEMNGVARVHFKIMDTPITVTPDDCLIAFVTPTGGISMSGSNTSYIGGRWFPSDVTFDTLVSNLSTSNYDDSGNTSIHASTNALADTELSIDLNVPFRVTDMELYLEKLMQKEFAAISTSIDNINFLEWEASEVGSNQTGFEDGFDGIDSVDFGATVRRIKVAVNRSFRYVRFKVTAPLHQSVGVNELDFISDETAIDYKASDISLIIGNDAVPRVSNISTGDQCYIDLTTPTNQTGYVYGLEFFGKIQNGDTYIQILSFEKTGDIYKLIDRQLAKKISVEVVPTFKLHQYVLLSPLKVFQGNYIAVHADSGYHGNLILNYDSNATATTPIIDGGNVGGRTMGVITVSNPDTELEDWTVTCASLAPEKWDVVGSVSGTMDNQAETDVSYVSLKGATTAEVSFLISSAGAGAQIGDFFTFSTRQQGDSLRFNNSDIESMAEGDTIDGSIFGTSFLYNFAIKGWQEPFINELWIDDADVGGFGDSETLRIYNKTGKLGQEVEVDILEADDGSHLLIQLSDDDIVWHSYGEAGIPLLLPDILGGSYETIYVRSNIASAVDKVYETRLRTRMKTLT